ncbi:MAG: 2-oxo acid dehydrogenase subunit E2 [Natronomonas sp.]
MGYIVRMPQLGMSMEEGTVVEWVLEEGERVDVDDVIATVESEKTTAEVESREDGVVRRILVEEGGTVEPGDPIGIVAGADEDISDLVSDVGTPDVDTSEGEDVAISGPSSPSGTGVNAPQRDDTDETDVKATPGARKLAESESVDLTGVEGSGPQGVVTEDDVSAHLEDEIDDFESSDDDQKPLEIHSSGATRTVVESSSLSGLQQTIRDRLSESYRDAVHVTLDRTFDARTLKATVTAGRAAGATLSLIDLLVKVTGRALSDHPPFNAVFEDGEHRLIDEVNVGVAVDIDRGLVTPVVPDVDARSVESVNEVRTELVDLVQSGDYTMDDLSGGTFTISNLGHFGIDRFDPIINPPQIAILGIGRVRTDETMTLSLSFDHRIVNGADAARFLDTIVEVATDGSALAEYFRVEIEPVENVGEEGPATGYPSGSPRDEETRDVRVESTEGLSGSYETAGVDGAVAFDEPIDMGGSGRAPTPVEHLLGALGACLSLSVRAMAERDDAPVGSIDCDVEGSPESGPLASVTVHIDLESDAPDDVLDRIVTKAQRACYVERALAEDVDVSVTWHRA